MYTSQNKKNKNIDDQLTVPMLGINPLAPNKPTKRP